VPPGNYSGICHIDSCVYALVDDKSPRDGFYLFKIDIDSVNGSIKNVSNLGFRSSYKPNRDGEGIAFLPKTKTICIAGEGDGKIREYALDGSLTGRVAQMPETHRKISRRYGLESLTYSQSDSLLYTCTEAPLTIDDDSLAVVRILSFNSDLQPVNQMAYIMDAPEGVSSAALNYAHGISELLALPDGRLLVLEREFFVPKSKIGAWVACKIYIVDPLSAMQEKENMPSLKCQLPVLQKQLLTQWRTSLALFRYELANYEGMCLGPRLTDGSQTIILVADSQNQYAGVLRDFFKTIVVK